MSANPAGRRRWPRSSRLIEPQRLAARCAGALRRPLAAPSGLPRDSHPRPVSAIRGLGTRLAIITESHTGPYLAPSAGDGDEIDLRRALAGERGRAVQPQLEQLRQARCAARDARDPGPDRGVRPSPRARRGPRSALAISAIDEFSALGADNVIALLARGREAGVSVLLATQELADLDRAAPGCAIRCSATPP